MIVSKSVGAAGYSVQRLITARGFAELDAYDASIRNNPGSGVKGGIDSFLDYLKHDRSIHYLLHTHEDPQLSHLPTTDDLVCTKPAPGPHRPLLYAPTLRWWLLKDG